LKYFDCRYFAKALKVNPIGIHHHAKGLIGMQSATDKCNALRFWPFVLTSKLRSCPVSLPQKKLDKMLENTSLGYPITICSEFRGQKLCSYKTFLPNVTCKTQT
jgi:hypothetical protein